MTMPKLNTHVVGVSALTLLIAALGYFGSGVNEARRPLERSLSAQRIERPAQTASVSTQQQSNRTAWDSRFLGDMNRAPMTEHRSASATQEGAQQPAQGDQRSESFPSSWMSSLGSAASAAKNWSKEDWDIAARAVSEHRSAAKSSQPSSETTSSESAAREPQTWQPPEEIAHKAKPSQR